MAARNGRLGSMRPIGESRALGKGEVLYCGSLPLTSLSSRHLKFDHQTLVPPLAVDVAR